MKKTFLTALFLAGLTAATHAQTTGSRTTNTGSKTNASTKKSTGTKSATNQNSSGNSGLPMGDSIMTNSAGDTINAAGHSADGERRIEKASKMKTKATKKGKTGTKSNNRTNAAGGSQPQ